MIRIYSFIRIRRRVIWICGKSSKTSPTQNNDPYPTPYLLCSLSSKLSPSLNSVPTYVTAIFILYYFFISPFPVPINIYSTAFPLLSHTFHIPKSTPRSSDFIQRLRANSPMGSSAERRLRLIQAHLLSDAHDSLSPISANPTAGEFFQGTVLFSV